MKKRAYTIGISLLSLTANLFAATEPYPQTNDWRRSFDDKQKLPNQLLELDSSFDYTTIGVAIPIPLPGFGIGHRQKFDDGSAIDISAHLATAIVMSGLSLNCSYLKYLNEKNFYFGGGAGFGLFFVTIVPLSYDLYPFISIGRESETNFHQLNASVVSFSAYGVGFFPRLTYSYGFKF